MSHESDLTQVWLNSDSNELSQSWVKLANLLLNLSQSWANQEKLVLSWAPMGMVPK